MSSLSQTLAESIATAEANDLPIPVVEEAKRLVLDLLGVALAATEIAPFPNTLRNLISELGGKQEATVFRTPGKLPALQAVLVNAAYAHALDMDDGHRYGALHPGTVIIPAALAVAEMVHADCHKLILGIVMGYEVMIRLGMAINPASLNRGFHPTGTTGSVGSAVTCGCIMGLDADQMTGALGLAGLCSAGLLQVNHESSAAAVKPLNPARAAQGGLLAAMLAKQGCLGPTNIFEGQDGFFRAFSDEVTPQTLVADLGERFEIRNTYTKFYAACRHAHAAIDAALSLYRQHELSLEQIDSIQVATYPQVLRLAGIANPTSISGARFSTAFSIALALYKGDAGATRYTQDNLHDPHLQRLAQRISLTVSPHWEKQYPQQRGATVSVQTSDGRSLKTDVALAKGEPENRASWAQTEEKYYQNATVALSAAQARSLCSVVSKLPEVALEELVALL